MTIIRRRIEPNPVRGLRIWKQQPGWYVFDCWRLRLEVIAA